MLKAIDHLIEWHFLAFSGVACGSLCLIFRTNGMPCIVTLKSLIQVVHSICNMFFIYTSISERPIRIPIQTPGSPQETQIAFPFYDPVLFCPTRLCELVQMANYHPTRSAKSEMQCAQCKPVQHHFAHAQCSLTTQSVLLACRLTQALYTGSFSRE